MNLSKPIVLLLFLGACGLTPQGDFVREAIKSYGAKAADAGLTNAEYFLCEAAPVGAVKKRYGGGKSKSYNALCDRNGGDIVK